MFHLAPPAKKSTGNVIYVAGCVDSGKSTIVQHILNLAREQHVQEKRGAMTTQERTEDLEKIDYSLLPSHSIPFALANTTEQDDADNAPSFGSLVEDNESEFNSTTTTTNNKTDTISTDPDGSMVYQVVVNGKEWTVVDPPPRSESGANFCLVQWIASITVLLIVYKGNGADEEKFYIKTLLNTEMLKKIKVFIVSSTHLTRKVDHTFVPLSLTMEEFQSVVVLNNTSMDTIFKHIDRVMAVF
jgi:hypothetical protein